MKRTTLITWAGLKFILAFVIAQTQTSYVGLMVAILVALLGVYLFVLAIISKPDDTGYVLQQDGQSAKLGDYPLSLVDKDGRVIYITRKSAYTLLDDVVIEPARTWCTLNNHNLHFFRTDKGLYVRWESDLQVIKA